MDRRGEGEFAMGGEVARVVAEVTPFAFIEDYGRQTALLRQFEEGGDDGNLLSRRNQAEKLGIDRAKIRLDAAQGFPAP